MKTTKALVALLLVGAGCAGVPGQTANEPVQSGSLASSPASGSSPASLSFALESDAVAEATVTFAEGGMVSATAADGSTFELLVPPAAVADDIEIRMTPLTDVKGIGAGPVHAVLLEPEGLEFFDAARLTVTPSTPIPIADQVMFQATGEGADPIAALIDVASKPIVILLQHFTVAGTALAEGMGAWYQARAQNAYERIANQTGAFLQAERKRQMAGAPQSPGFYDELVELFENADRDVLGPLREAALLTCEGAQSYIATVRGLEYHRTIIHLSDDETSAATREELARAFDATFTACEREAIQQCQEQPDPVILIAFWIGWERQQEFLGATPIVLPDDFAASAKEICEPQGYQFEFSGTGTGLDMGFPVPFEWQYWGLLCEGSEEWKIWEIFDGVLGSSATGPPSDNTSVPYLVTFDQNGSMTSISWELLGGPIAQATTASGNTFALSPGDRPTTVTARLNAGAGVEMLTVTAPVEPADGTIASCEPAE